MSNFRVGQDVVCIKRGKWTTYAGYDFQAPDPKYLEVCKIIRFMRNGDLVLFGYPMTGYHPSRFRPVAKRKTDISIFKEILNKTSVDA